MSFTYTTGDQETSSADEFTLVIDAMALDPNKGQEEVMTPRVQVEILQLLVRIQKTEGWDCWVLFNGDGLRQVEHGGDFMGVRVFFSPTPPQRVPTLLECVKVLKKQRRDVVMVTQDGTLETRAEDLGALCLRGDTFKKGYEDLFTVRHRPQSRLMRRRTVEMERQSAVRDMIDLVE